MAPSEFCEISIDIFLNMTGQVPFDVYVQLTPEKFTKVSRRNDPVDRSRFESYFNKGAKHLYILRKDRREYIGATERFIKIILQNAPISSANASRAVEELSEQTLFEIFEDAIFDDQSLRRSQEIAKSYISLMKSDVKVLTQFIQLCRNETYLVRHSIATSVMAILIARAGANINDRMLQIVGLGALLHDIGMSSLPQEISDVDRKLSDDEWVEVKRHPQYAVTIIKNVKNFPEEVSLILEHHHENFDGSGYPRGLRGEEIYFPARVVAIADCFSALTTRRGGRSLFSPEEALALLQTESHKFDPKLLKSFGELLLPNKKKKVA